jgi:omega-amidase
MKICSAQVAACWEDPEGTLQKIDPLIKDAASSGASLIAFPEQFATGWDPRSILHIQDPSGPVVSALAGYAREYSIAIVGSFRQAATPLPKNTAVVIGRDGEISTLYAKMHPFTFAGEETHYSAGDDVAVFNLNGVRLGLAICYDLRFPELFRLYARRGVHGVIVPAAWPESRLQHWELFIMARAAENQMYVIGINTTGKNPVDTYAGCSMTADPDGSVIARADEREMLLYSDIEPALVEGTRKHFPAQNDRRTDLYRRL